jgi:hypothetical protein
MLEAIRPGEFNQAASVRRYRLNGKLAGPVQPQYGVLMSPTERPQTSNKARRIGWDGSQPWVNTQPRREGASRGTGLLGVLGVLL